MEYIRIVGETAGGGSGGLHISPERAAIAAGAIVALVIIGYIIMRRKN